MNPMNSLSDILSDHVHDLFPHDSQSLSNTAVQSPPAFEDISLTPAIDSCAPTNTNESSPSNIPVEQIRQTIHRIQDELDSILRIIENPANVPPAGFRSTDNSEHLPTGDRILEGVFNGQKMIGADGEEYPVPPNYASKSKLVEGDIMKLTIIARTGAFIYKQISQTPRKRAVGSLQLDPTTNQWSIQCNGKMYKILTASATFYRGKPGDDVVFLIPENGESQWGAVENIIHT